MAESFRRIDNLNQQRLLHSMKVTKDVSQPVIPERIVKRAERMTIFSGLREEAEKGDLTAQAEVERQRQAWNEEFEQVVGRDRASAILNIRALGNEIAGLLTARDGGGDMHGVSDGELEQWGIYYEEVMTATAMAVQGGASFGNETPIRDKSVWENSEAGSTLEDSVGVDRWRGTDGLGKGGEGIGIVCQYILTSEPARKILEKVSKLNRVQILTVDKLEDEMAILAGIDMPDEETEMVMAYLSSLRDKLIGAGQGGQASGETSQGSPTSESRSAFHQPPIGTKMDGEQMGQQATLQYVQESVERMSLKGTKITEVQDWAFALTEQLSRETFFFTGMGWNQLGPVMERTLRESFRGQPEAKLNQAIKEMQAILTLRIQEMAILHCDGSPKDYAERLPPPAAMPDYQWGNLAETAERHPVLRNIRQWIKADAYGRDSGAYVIGHLESKEAMNEWAEQIAREIMGNPQKVALFREKFGDSFNPDVLKEEARAAIAMFIVEDYAKWVAWSCKTSRTNLERVPWMKVPKEKLRAGERERSCIWMWRNIEKGKKGWVEVWSSQFQGGSGKKIIMKDGEPVMDPRTGRPKEVDAKSVVQQPYLGMVRPSDLTRVKTSWSETILGPAEEAMLYLVVAKYLYGEDINKRQVYEKGRGGADYPDGTPYGIERMLTPSLVGAKDFVRYGDIVQAWFNGSQAEGLDNWEDWLKGVNQTKAFLQMHPDVGDIGGAVIGDMIYVKVMAMMENRKGAFLLNLSRAIALDVFSTPSELEKARGGLIGTEASGEFGMIAEATKRGNFKIGTERYDTAMAMLATSVGDPQTANYLLKVKKGVMKAKGVVEVASVILGGGGGGGGKKRR